ncbi:MULTISPECIES: ferredoxin [Rhodococcus]|uniref:Ferredoxin n=1 Tax=Rhodococcus opacus TaxID=37919 RepID=A0A076EZX8_RHOOP|nr:MULTISPECIES: ferredoxin [Rhodococcus]AII10983.1 ferredoxin [Rhodococcus opacus]OUS79689.1 ferredoxin [Rhodococcus sp. NCIMB 12038]
MAVVQVNLAACQGYANCVVGADDYFDINDDGVVEVIRAEVPDSERARVETAARSCPVSALWLVDE